MQNLKKKFRALVVTILRWEASLVLRKYKPKIIAITGSVGKTSTKDAVYAVVSRFAHARKSEKSFNSEIGVPLTILGCQNAWNNPFLWLRNLLEGLIIIIFPNYYPSWLVLEVGADRPGDIASLAKWLKPDVVIMTRLSEVPVHVEFFDSPQAVAEEKQALVTALKKDGLLILNRDDEIIYGFREDAPTKKIVTYGEHETATVKVTNYEISYGENDNLKLPIGFSFKAEVEGHVVPINVTGSIGRHHRYPLLAAVAVGNALNFNLVHVAEALSNHEGPLGRMKLLLGVKQTMVIDDTYNSSPVAVSQALKTLKDLDVKGRKLAVLGDMMELGEYSAGEHKKVGHLVPAICDYLVVVGDRADLIADSAIEAGMPEANIRRFPDARKAGKHLDGIIKPGDVVLVKGSQSMRMERAVEEIMMHPENKEKLLVRQEWEWAVR